MALVIIAIVVIVAVALVIRHKRSDGNGIGGSRETPIEREDSK